MPAAWPPTGRARPSPVSRWWWPARVARWWLPTDFDWHLLAGDASALPAIQRRLAELPADACGTLLLAVDAPDRRSLHVPPGLQLHWLDNDETLVTALQAWTLPAGDGFAWCAGEASTMARLRGVLRDKGLPKDAMRVAAYWKRGASSYHAELAD